MKQNGLKVMLDSLFESSLINSSSFGNLVNNVRILALETKKLAEFIVTLKSRLDQHENLIMSLYDQKNEKTVFEYTKTTKTGTSKPN